ncbi:MAG TPA: thiamine diphosphokinase [Candidatus Fimenecus excrementigallinarum]|uniref:Thiamine diphosphokinase n=1 Tax=Candidatus Fimenecus excrementigallinarum TaxID=2840816 RepID=A0A9D1IE21_9FIRM|nr:thiamine diphosphokinase [Candidatus Fimenecus excrementigallinarum]
MGNVKYADCAIFAAGIPVSEQRVRAFVGTDTYLIAADAGYAFCRSLGLCPQLVVGDFDSGEPTGAVEGTEIVRLNPVKDETDTASALCRALDRGFRNIVLFGATGGRLDHTFANLDLCAFAKGAGAALTVVDDHHEIFALRNECRTICGDFEKYVSVFPVGGACTVSLRGFKYPLDHRTLEPFCGLGVSNETTADRAEITVHEGTALIFVTDKDR